MALHPQFEENGLLFVNYVDRDDFSIISRFEVNLKSYVCVADSEKIIWDKEPYKGGYKKGMVYYTSWTYYKNEKKIKEDSITTKDFNTTKELIEKGKTNEFFMRNEYIYQCK